MTNFFSTDAVCGVCDKYQVCRGAMGSRLNKIRLNFLMLRRLTHNREGSADTPFGWFSQHTAAGCLVSRSQPDRPELKELLNKI